MSTHTGEQGEYERLVVHEHVHVIVNPASGAGAFSADDVQEQVNAAETGTWRVHALRPGEEARAVAQAALEQGADAVIACGGDGTILEVAEALIGQAVPLGVIPAGTANVFAAELGLPAEPGAALAALIDQAWDVRTIDVGQVHGQHFLLRLGIGFEAAMTSFASREEKERYGRWAYVQAALRARRSMRPVRYRLTLDGTMRTVRGVTCIVCNSGNVGIPDVKLAPEISVSDGLLNVIVVRRASVTSMIALVLNALRSFVPGVPRQAYHGRLVSGWPAREVEVLAMPEQVATRDGETIDAPFPLQARVVPGALRVVVPRAQTD